MLNRDQASSIFDKLRKYSSADEIELLDLQRTQRADPLCQ